MNIEKVKLYFMNISTALWNIIWRGVIVGIDRLGNTLLGGDPDMTLSGRMGRDINKGLCWVCKPICWVLGKIQVHHCQVQAELEANFGAKAADQGD
jgi:hypothetical protein